MKVLKIKQFLYGNIIFYKAYYKQFPFTNNLLPKHEVHVDGLEQLAQPIGQYAVLAIHEPFAYAV